MASSSFPPPNAFATHTHPATRTKGTQSAIRQAGCGIVRALSAADACRHPVQPHPRFHDHDAARPCPDQGIRHRHARIRPAGRVLQLQRCAFRITGRDVHRSFRAQAFFADHVRAVRAGDTGLRTGSRLRHAADRAWYGRDFRRRDGCDGADHHRRRHSLFTPRQGQRHRVNCIFSFHGRRGAAVSLAGQSFSMARAFHPDCGPDLAVHHCRRAHPAGIAPSHQRQEARPSFFGDV